MSQLINTLIVEDNPNDAELLVLELERAGFQINFARVDTPQSFTSAIEQRRWDIIFSDHSMPHFSSFQALTLRNQYGLDTPFIILSGTMGEDLAVEAMKSGANDYFVKGRLTRLSAAVNRELQEAQERETRKKVEQELEHFVASLTHDLRTPILAELRVLELLDGDAFGPLSVEQHEIMQELIHSNHFVQHMVNNILYAYKYKQHRIKLEREKTDLAQFLTSVTTSLTVRALVREKQHHLKVMPVDSIPPVEIDRAEMQRVMMNLIKNAVDYTPVKGEIILSLEYQGDYVRINVEDTGSGVDPEIEPRLFMPYATSATRKFRQVGIGLGLYLSKQIVEAHSGRIGYRKAPEQGSIFYVELPVHSQHSVLESVPAEQMPV
jgi:two-component system sensor histidine kinase EvgS